MKNTLLLSGLLFVVIVVMKMLVFGRGGSRGTFGCPRRSLGPGFGSQYCMILCCIVFPPCTGVSGGPGGPVVALSHSLSTHDNFLTIPGGRVIDLNQPLSIPAPMFIDTFGFH